MVLLAAYYIVMQKTEVQNSRVTKSSYETELRKMTSHFELLTRKCLKKFRYILYRNYSVALSAVSTRQYLTTTNDI